MRMHERAIAATARPAGDTIELVSPAPGLFRIALRTGDAVGPGSLLGELEILGQLTAVVVPEPVRGAVIATCSHGPASGGAARLQGGPREPEGLARPAVDFGAVLVAIDPRAAAGAGTGEPTTPAAAAAAGITGEVFRAPTSGRFYVRPAPGKPPFVEAGAQLVPGATICLLEVMKTFHRVTYAGEPARVREVLVMDGADVNAGDPLLALE